MLEVVNLKKSRPNELPEHFGFSLVVRPQETDAITTLEKIKSAWIVVANWGRMWDEDTTDWPSRDECLNQLPDWLAFCFRADDDDTLTSWFYDLYEREWVWWSGAVVSRNLKIDLDASSVPFDHWMLIYVIEKAGGTVIYSDGWIGSEKIPIVDQVWSKQKKIVYYEDVETNVR